MPLPHRHRGVTADPAARFNVAHNTAFARDPRTRTDREMIADGGLSADHDIIAQRGAPGDTDLAR